MHTEFFGSGRFRPGNRSGSRWRIMARFVISGAGLPVAAINV